MEKKYLTQEGFGKLKKELKYLKDVKRKEIAQRLEESSSFGDLSENSEYQEAKEAQAFLEGRILELEEIIRAAVIVPKEKQGFAAQIGSTVLVKSNIGEERFMIVGAEEVNLLKGKISSESPLGSQLLNQPKGAVVEVITPQGKAKYKILEIE